MDKKNSKSAAKNVNVNNAPAINPTVLAIAEMLAKLQAGTSATAPATEPAAAPAKKASPERNYYAIKFPGGGIVKFSVKAGNIGRMWVDNGNVSLAEFTGALNVKAEASDYERSK